MSNTTAVALALAAEGLRGARRAVRHRAGHGGASGRYDALKDRAFEFAWLLQQIGAAR